MQIVTTKYGGFCFGVKRAVDHAMSMDGDGNYVLGEIIHNEHVVEELQRKGVKTVNDIEEVPDGAVLLIRTPWGGRENFPPCRGKGSACYRLYLSVRKRHSEYRKKTSFGRVCRRNYRK